MASTHAWDHLSHDMREEMHDLTHFATIDATHQGRVALWVTLTVLPLLWGLDMLTHVVTDSATWQATLATWTNDLLPGDAADAVLWIGAITVLAGLLVAAMPQIGGDVLGVWFVLLAANLFSVDQLAYLAVGMLALAFCSFAMAWLMRGDRRQEG